jgi:DNA polymerase elongation subunit (family B)
MLVFKPSLIRRPMMPRVKLPIKLLYLDIETTPHEGTFWNLFPKYIPINQLKNPTEMLCWAAKWEGSREMFYRSVRDGDKHITDMWELLDEADAVVHYNGKSFDIKHLNREFARLGLPPPSKYDQVDLLSTVRQNFRLASNKLDFVCQYFGIGKKVKHVGIELWYGCMNNNESDWNIMEKYNKRDVTLLPKLYKFLRPWIKSHPNVGMWVKDPKSPTCSTCGSTDVTSKGEQHNGKTASYKRWKCNTCGTPLRSRLSSGKTSENVLVRSQ